ncbi:hypothetical protein ACIBSW_12575 [Actinoplanes sp. NPDC049668]|uniref:hypothetical protein n=1 Tax=unclassified Actinoplanes TaxID=2626549 RepID=UPI00339E3DD9
MACRRGFWIVLAADQIFELLGAVRDTQETVDHQLQAFLDVGDQVFLPGVPVAQAGQAPPTGGPERRPLVTDPLDGDPHLGQLLSQDIEILRMREELAGVNRTPSNLGRHRDNCS